MKQYSQIDILKNIYVYYHFIPLILKVIMKKLTKDGSMAKNGASTHGMRIMVQHPLQMNFERFPSRVLRTCLKLSMLGTQER